MLYIRGIPKTPIRAFFCSMTFFFLRTGQWWVLRVPACKNQTNSSFRGKGLKFDLAHILMVDRVGHDKNYWIVFLAKYSSIGKKYANYQIPLKSPFHAPFYKSSLRASHAKPHYSSVFRTLKSFCAMLKCVLG